MKHLQNPIRGPRWEPLSTAPYLEPGVLVFKFVFSGNGHVGRPAAGRFFASAKPQPTSGLGDSSSVRNRALSSAVPPDQAHQIQESMRPVGPSRRWEKKVAGSR